MSSPKGLAYEVFDVFAESAYAGNPLAVVHGAGQLDAGTMQRIAREMNLSETTFVLHASARDGAFDVRVFTPAHEMPYAGHPTLGTAFAIRARGLAGDGSALALRLGIGVVPVRFDAEGLAWLTAPRADLVAGPEAASVAAALGLPVAALDPRLPLEVATTGEPQLLVPLREAAALSAIALSLPAYRRLRESGAPGSLYAFTSTAPGVLAARMFAPDLGVPEDPATGSAAGWLGAYLARHRVLGSGDFDARIEQGREMGRPSLLHVRARRGASAAPEISVGGRVIPVARGELL
jgi:trans-2,3-dihydro-3-hydroxyanthranilate isomerase